MWLCLVCLLLCKEDGSSPVSPITKRRDMGMYEVPLSMSLLGLRMGRGTMLANFYRCGILLVKSSFQHAREACESMRAYVF